MLFKFYVKSIKLFQSIKSISNLNTFCLKWCSNKILNMSRFLNNLFKFCCFTGFFIHLTEKIHKSKKKSANKFNYLILHILKMEI